MKPTIIDKYLNYLDTLSDKPDKPAKYKISIFEEILYFIPTAIISIILVLLVDLILIPILIGLIVYIIPYIIYRRYKVRKAMKFGNEYIKEEDIDIPESEETEC